MPIRQFPVKIRKTGFYQGENNYHLTYTLPGSLISCVYVIHMLKAEDRQICDQMVRVISCKDVIIPIIIGDSEEHFDMGNGQEDHLAR